MNLGFYFVSMGFTAVTLTTSSFKLYNDKLKHSIGYLIYIAPNNAFLQAITSATFCHL